MSKIKYSKDAQKHEAAKKVKRDLTALAKEYEGHFFIFIEVTGVERYDIGDLKAYERMLYDKLLKSITDDIEQNKESYDGYYTPHHLRILNCVTGIQKIKHYMINNYCLYEIYPPKKILDENKIQSNI